MAVKTRWKDKLDEAIGFAKNTVSNTVRNVVRQPAQQNTTQNNITPQAFQRFQEGFSNGYNNFVAQQQQNAQQKQKDFVDFTSKVINRVSDPKTVNRVVSLADKTAELVSPDYRLKKANVISGIKAYQATDKVIPGGWDAGLKRVKTSIQEDPGQYWIGRGFAQAPQTSRILGKILGNEQAGEDFGYALRGAGNLTPFNITNEMGLAGQKTKEISQKNAPKNERQQRAEDVGQAIAGTILTAPIGGGGSAVKMLTNVGSRALQGTTLGLAMTTAEKLMTEGRLPNAEELADGGVNGLENSWQLAFTNAATDKLLGSAKLTSGLTEKSIDQTYRLLGNAGKMGASNAVKRGLFAKGLQTLFLRSLAEVPAENTLWTFVDQLDGDAKNDFVTEWINNLPGNILGNVVFGMASGGVRGAWNYKGGDLQAAQEALQKTVQKFMNKRVGGFVNAGVFFAPYKRGDIGTLEKELDDLLGTQEFRTVDKWTSILPARENAIRELESYAEQGDPDAITLLSRVYDLQKQIEIARGVKNGELDQNQFVDEYAGKGEVSQTEELGIKEDSSSNSLMGETQKYKSAIENVINGDDELAKIEQGSAVAEIGRETLNDGTEAIYLSEISNKIKGNGDASQLLNNLIKQADETNIPIVLRANVSNNFTDGTGLNQKQLVDWYKRKGFVSANELSDFADDTDFMVYQPKQSDIWNQATKELDTVKAIEEDMAKNLEEQKIAEENPIEPDKSPQDIVKEEYQKGAEEKLFGSEEQTIKPEEPKAPEEGGSVLEKLQSDFEKARELRKSKWDLPTYIGHLKTQWADKFYYAKKYDPELYLNMRLFGGGGDTRTAAIIERNIGPVIKHEADSGRKEDFANLIALDRLNELVDRGFKRSLTKEQIQQGYAELQAKYSPEELADMNADAQKFRGFLAVLLQKAEEVGLVSKEAVDAARENNEFYVTLESIGQLYRDFNDENWLTTNQGKSGASFNVSRQDVLKKIGDSESGIADPTESSLQYIVSTIQNIEKNAILKNFVESRMDDGTGVAIPLRQAENVRERIRINTEIGELKPLQRKIQRLIQTRGKWVRELQSELNKLNLAGYRLSLKPEDDVNVNPTRLERVLESKVGKLNELDKELDNLNLAGLGISLQQKPNTAEPTEYFKRTGGKFSNGKDQYTKVTLYPRIKAVIEQMITMSDSELKRIKNKIQTTEGKINGQEKIVMPEDPAFDLSNPGRTVVKQGLIDEILDIKEQLRMQKFVDELISLPDAELNKIKRKIETREGKVSDVMSEIYALKEGLDSVKDDIAQLRLDRGEIKDIPEAPEGYGTINVFRDGIKEEWAVPKELEIAIKNLDAQKSGTVIDWYNTHINQPFKKFVTAWNPVFSLLVNPIKDIQNALFAENTEKGLKDSGSLAFGYVGAVSDAFGLSKQRENWLLSGGGSSGMMAADMKADPEKALKELQEKGTFTNRFKHVVKSPIQVLEYVSRSTEESTRLSKFNKDFAKLSDEQKAMLDDPYVPLAQLPKELREIALESRNITQDFSRMGTMAQQVNKIIPFFNPALQGTLRLGALAKDHPQRFVSSMVILTAIPAAAAYINNRQYEDYKDIKDYERRGNMIWIYKDRTPEEIEQNAPIHAFKIPLGQLGAPFYNVAEELYRFVDDTEPDKMNRLASSMIDVGISNIGNMSPVGDLASMTPVPLKLAIQNRTNTDLYTGMPIEPDYIDVDGDGITDAPREEVPSAYRRGYYTGPTTELMGRITGPTLGLSPAQLDNLIYGATGGTGKALIAGTDTLLGSPPELKSNPLLNRFMAPRGGQLAANEKKLEEQENKQIQDEIYGGGINFNGLGLAEEASATGDTFTPKTTKNGEEMALPSTTEELGVLYSDAEKTVEGFKEKQTKIQYGDYQSETKRKKDLKKLQEEYDRATEMKNLIELKYPQQVYEIGLGVYGKGSSQGVEKRGDWAYEQLSKTKSEKEFQGMVNEMWEKGVLTKSSNGVAAYIEDVYGIDVTKYTGSDKRLKKSIGNGGEKIPKLSITIPKVESTPGVKVSALGKNVSNILNTNSKTASSSGDLYKQLRLRAPKPLQIKLPKRKKISAKLTPMRTRIRGL